MHKWVSTGMETQLQVFQKPNHPTTIQQPTINNKQTNKQGHKAREQFSCNITIKTYK